MSYSFKVERLSMRPMPVRVQAFPRRHGHEGPTVSADVRRLLIPLHFQRIVRTCFGKRRSSRGVPVHWPGFVKGCGLFRVSTFEQARLEPGGWIELRT